MSERGRYYILSATEKLLPERRAQISLPAGPEIARSHNSTWCIWQIVSMIIIIAQATTIFVLNAAARGACLSIHGMQLQRTEPRKIYQHSRYVSHNETEASAAWDAILPGHGVVMIEPQYAAFKDLPKTMELPDSGGKSLYVIEAYHAMHCIVNLRQHYVALRNNESWHWSHGHDLHCFDALRQYVMCNIDDTLLHTWGKRDAGHDQQKLCHDWDRLREWAEERSASYFDVEPGQGVRHIGNYHAGDGLPFGSLSGDLTVGQKQSSDENRPYA